MERFIPLNTITDVHHNFVQLSYKQILHHFLLQKHPSTHPPPGVWFSLLFFVFCGKISTYPGVIFFRVHVNSERWACHSMLICKTEQRITDEQTHKSFCPGPSQKKKEEKKRMKICCAFVERREENKMDGSINAQAGQLFNVTLSVRKKRNLFQPHTKYPSHTAVSVRVCCKGELNVCVCVGEGKRSTELVFVRV